MQTQPRSRSSQQFLTKRGFRPKAVCPGTIRFVPAPTSHQTHKETTNIKRNLSHNQNLVLKCSERCKDLNRRLQLFLVGIAAYSPSIRVLIVAKWPQPFSPAACRKTSGRISRWGTRRPRVRVLRASAAHEVAGAG